MTTIGKACALLKKTLPASLAIAVCVPAFSQAVSQGAATQKASSVSDITASANLLKVQIFSSIGDRVTTASAEDLEGMIAFAISQSDYPEAVIIRVLNDMEASATSPALLTAVRAVRKALVKRRLQNGTAAITGSGNGGFSEFSSPGTAGGGGTAGYTTG